MLALVVLLVEDTGVKVCLLGEGPCLGLFAPSEMAPSEMVQATVEVRLAAADLLVLQYLLEKVLLV